MSIIDTLFSHPGAIIVPGGGIAVAQPGVIANNAVSSASLVSYPGVIGGKAISTTSDNQSLGKTVFHVPKGQGSWPTGLPIVPQMSMIVTPQMKSLNISSTIPQQFQNHGIAAEKSTGMRDQDTQTEATETFQQAVAPRRITLQQSGESHPVEYSKKTLTQEGARFKSDQSRQSHHEKTNTSQAIEKGAGLNSADEGRQYHSSRVSSDYEVFLLMIWVINTCSIWGHGCMRCSARRAMNPSGELKNALEGVQP